MNYSKQGALNKQQALAAKAPKWGRKLLLLLLKLTLVVCLSAGIVAAGGVLGVLKGVIDTSPDISQMTIAPTRFSTFIYDSEGNQTAKLVASDERIKVNNEMVGNTTITSYFDNAVSEQVYQDLLAAGYNEDQAYVLLYSGGLKIFSTQDPDVQAICDTIYMDESNYPESSKWLLEYRLSVARADGETQHHSSAMYRKYFRENGKSNFNMLYSSKEDAYEAIKEYQAAVLDPGDEILAESIELTPQPQVSISVIDQSTGHVVAMVGDRGTKEGSRTLNCATETTRPPGSTFKVLAFFEPALDASSFTLATTVNDAPFNYYDGTLVKNWYSNSDTPHWGLVPIRMGIYDSLNIVAVKTLTQISPSWAMNTC